MNDNEKNQATENSVSALREENKKLRDEIEALKDEIKEHADRLQILEEEIFLKSQQQKNVVFAPIPPSDPEKDVPFKYERINHNSEIRITQYLGFEQEIVVIPEKIEGLPVTEISYRPIPKNEIDKYSDWFERGNEYYIGAFQNCSFIKRICFPSSLKLIDTQAFGECTGITAVQFPESLKTIGSWIFSRNSNLEKVYIPKSVTEIRTYAFPEREDIVIYCHSGSYAMEWAMENGYQVRPAQEFSLD